MKALNTQNEALNGRPVTDEMKDISKAIGAGLEALGKGNDSKEDTSVESTSTDSQTEVK